MTPFSAPAPLLPAATSKSTSNPLLTLLPLLAIGFLAYFFFIRPQQRKAQAARKAQGSDIEVGDEVQTVGGVIGTVLEIHGDRYTLLTGVLGEDGNLDGPQPTRIVFVRQAIARKIDRIDDVRIDDDVTGETRRRRGGSGGRARSRLRRPSPTTEERRAAGPQGSQERGEPQVRGAGAAPAAAEPSHQCHRRGGRDTGVVRVRAGRQVVAAAGTRPGRGRGRRLHGPGAARDPGEPGRDGQHLEPASQRAGRVGCRGADHRERPDLRLHPRRDRCAAGAQADRPDGADVLPSGAVLGLPPDGAQALQDRSASPRRRAPCLRARRRRRSPPPASGSRRTAPHHRGSPRTTSRRIPSTPTVLPPVSRSPTTPRARSCCPGSEAPATTPPRRAASSGRPR